MKSLRFAQTSLGFSLLLTGCAAAPNSGGTTAATAAATQLSAWIAEATAPHISPVSPVTGDLTSTWTGADGNPIQVVVKAPAPTSGTIVTLSPVSGDNAPAIAAALATLGKAGGGQLVLQSGIFDIGTSVASTTPMIPINALHDITISGTGATLMLMHWGTGFDISNSQRIRIVGPTIRYANPAIITGTITQGSGSKGINLTLDPTQVSTTGPLTIYQVTTLNPQGPGYAITGYRLLLGTTGAAFTSLGSGVYSSSQLTGFNVGDKVAVKLTYYNGAPVVVNDNVVTTSNGLSYSSDIILDTVAIGNSSGFGVVAERMGRGFAVVNSNLAPATAGDGTTSIAYDGIHVSAAAGDILINNNKIAGTGDDGINIASVVSSVTQQDATGAYHISGAGYIVPGEKIALFDSQMNYLGTGVEVSRLPTQADGTSAVTLSGTIPNGSTAAFAREEVVLGNRYAVTNNTITNCDCHGTLAQDPNGLVSGNVYTGLRANAIRLLTSGAYLEGTGALNVVVSNNTISNTGADTQTGFVWAAIAAYGVLGNLGGSLGMTPLPVNANLIITGNTVNQTQDACLSIGDTATATVKGNTCTSVSLGGQPNTGITFASYPGSSALRSEGIWVDPQTTSNITVSQ